MKSIWLLIGNANTRKSSMVRCLLGVDNPATEVEVQSVTGTVLHIRAFISAVQEKKSVSPEELLLDLNDSHWKGQFKNLRNALVPLRYDPAEGQPAAEFYAQALLDDGWSIKVVVSLGEPARPWLQNSGLPYIEIPNSTSLPSNAIAAQVRAAFGWV